jgi:hypothetical protein
MPPQEASFMPPFVRQGAGALDSFHDSGGKMMRRDAIKYLAVGG